MMKPALKYWTFLLAVLAAIFAVIFGSFAASWHFLAPEEKTLVENIFDKLLPFPFVGAIILMVIIGTLVSLLFSYYIIPILKLAEEARLIATVNPAYRITPDGAREVVYLTEVINASAEAFQKLQLEVDERIRSAQAELHEERNRLAALMSELPGGVLVCNTAGQILLYNQHARKLLQSGNGKSLAEGQRGAWIGLGRSIFGVLDRDPIIQALQQQQKAAEKGQPPPVSSFLTTLHSGTCLRINMAPVFRNGESREDLTGFVLTLEDMTRQIEAVTHRDLIIKALTDGLQESLTEIRSSISSILAREHLPVEELHRYRQTIDRASRSILRRLIRAREEYARGLPQASTEEDVLAENLLRLLRDTIRERCRLEAGGRAEEGLWVRVDSLSLVQAISDLADRLQQHSNLSNLDIRLEKLGPEQASLAIAWPHLEVPEQLISEWENAPLFNDAQGRSLSFLQMVDRHGGLLRLEGSGSGICWGISLSLPIVPQMERTGIPAGAKARPVFYEFDLFNQTLQTELGQRLLRDLTYVVFDTETTGLNPAEGDEIVQIGAIRIVKGRLLFDETIDQLVNPQRPIPRSSVAVHGIEPENLQGQPTIEQVLPHFYAFAEGAVLVAHNAAFDMKFLTLKQVQTGLRFDQPVLDTLLLSSLVHPSLGTHALEKIAERLNIAIVGRHTALGDAIVTGEVLLKLIPLLEAQGIRTLEEALQASSKSPYARLDF
jgi:DNA polymerase-3 subunit epsilon